MAGFAFGDNLFSISLYVASSFAGFVWFMTFFSTYGVSFMPLGVQRFLILVEWSILVVGVYIGFFLILVGLISDFNIIV
jgi:hypothetical protein